VLYADVLGIVSDLMLYSCIQSWRVAKNKIRAVILKQNDTLLRNQRMYKQEIGFSTQKHGLGVSLLF
jgi:hypothetical protein